MRFDEFKSVLSKDDTTEVSIVIPPDEWNETETVIDKFTASATMLEMIGPEFERKIISARIANPQNLKDGSPLRVSFDGVDPQAFRILLYWAYRGSVPHEGHYFSANPTHRCFMQDEPEYHAILVRAWILGDKYNLPDFQNLVMLELLHRSAKGYATTALIDEAFCKTKPGSLMHRLMGEEVMFMVHVQTPRVIANADLDHLSRVDGVQEEIERAQKVWSEQGQVIFDRLPSTERPLNEDWKEYMIVGNGPEQHWVYRDLEE